MNTFQASCVHCDTSIPDERLRGAVTHLPGPALGIEALGACAHCKVGTRIMLRMHPDGSVTGMLRNRWHRWEPHRKNLAERIIDSASRLVRLFY